MKVGGKYYREILLKKQMLPVMLRVADKTFVFQLDSTPAHRARETVHLLQQETPDFIAARRYTSAAYVVMQCLSVCVSVTFVHSVKTNKISSKCFHRRVAKSF